MSLSFSVAGVPKPQGSSTPMLSATTGRPILRTSATLAGWRNTVIDRAQAAVDAAGWETVEDEAVSVSLDFVFTRPKSHSKKRQVAEGNRHRSRPDLDKLVRAVLDGLTVARVWGDDGQVGHLRASKTYGPQPGVWVWVEVLT